MAIKPILQIGDKVLKATNKTLLKSDHRIIDAAITDLTDTMREKEIVGIAGPQIGQNIKLFITEPKQTVYRATDQSDVLRVYINPKITKYSNEKMIAYEGCGSVSAANFFGPVERAKEIIIEAYDKNFIKFQLRCDGILARVIQHEYDHLFGIEFVEKITDYKKVMDFEHFQRLIRPSPEQMKAAVITVIEYTAA
jgi:peptide deformylase